MALQKLNAQVLQGGLALDNNGNMTLTGNLYATDVGDDDDPIEDFYVSEDSIWIGDQHKVQISSAGKHFSNKNRGIAVGIIVASASIGFFLAPMYTTYALAEIGWQKTLQNFRPPKNKGGPKKGREPKEYY